ncbi:MAG TPA: Rieske (2Fe-2S) protein [Tepidisphaeraceae bacterium]|jgi:nitrite reductase/ring-hydroxylating ferredoxin subunit
MAEINRRDFVVAAAASVACAYCLLGSAEEAEAQAAGGGTVDIGVASDFPKGTISGKFVKPNGLIVANEDDKIYAMSSKCPHKGSTVGVKDNKLRCPSHGSTFSEHGTPTGGPAKSSLVRYAIKADDKGRLIVDKSKSFSEKDWENPDSFVKVS